MDRGRLASGEGSIVWALDAPICCGREIHRWRRARPLAGEAACRDTRSSNICMVDAGTSSEKRCLECDRSHVAFGVREADYRLPGELRLGDFCLLQKRASMAARHRVTGEQHTQQNDRRRDPPPHPHHSTLSGSLGVNRLDQDSTKQPRTLAQGDEQVGLCVALAAYPPGRGALCLVSRLINR